MAQFFMSHAPCTQISPFLLRQLWDEIVAAHKNGSAQGRATRLGRLAYLVSLVLRREWDWNGEMDYRDYY